MMGVGGSFCRWGVLGGRVFGCAVGGGAVRGGTGAAYDGAGLCRCLLGRVIGTDLAVAILCIGVFAAAGVGFLEGLPFWLLVAFPAHHSLTFEPAGQFSFLFVAVARLVIVWVIPQAR